MEVFAVESEEEVGVWQEGVRELGETDVGVFTVRHGEGGRWWAGRRGDGQRW